VRSEGVDVFVMLAKQHPVDNTAEGAPVFTSEFNRHCDYSSNRFIIL